MKYPLVQQLRADREAAESRAPEQLLVQLGLGKGQHEDLMLAQKPPLP